MTWSVLTPISAPQANGRVAGLVWQYDSAVPDAHARLMLRLIKSTPGFTPPVASRAISYFGVALYEALVPGMEGYRSLQGLLSRFPSTPGTPRPGLHWPTAITPA
ncbi:MAG: hypothetical protein ACRDWA_02785 [Acidimicrobiia bacterium]